MSIVLSLFTNPFSHDPLDASPKNVTPLNCLHLMVVSTAAVVDTVVVAVVVRCTPITELVPVVLPLVDALEVALEVTVDDCVVDGVVMRQLCNVPATSAPIAELIRATVLEHPVLSRM